MDVTSLIREFLEDKKATRYSDELIADMIDEAIYYIAKKSYQFRKTVELQSTVDGFIELPNNFGILQVFSSCEVEVKNIVEVSCDCSAEDEVEDLSGLEYIIEGTNPNILKLCPKVKSLAVYENIEDIIINTIEITEAQKYVNNEHLVLTYITKPTLEETPIEWKMPIVYYVTGTLLRFDKDIQNRDFGNENLRICDALIEVLRKKKV